MNKHESYVSLETAKLLKQAGFDWGCDSFYGLDVRHNGESIDFDEQCELKAEGKESEIEYVDGGTIYNFYHSNKEDKDYGGYSCPTLAIVQKWLREKEEIDINILTDFDSVKRFYYVRHVIKDSHYKTFYITDHQSYVYFNTYEETQEAGIQKCLEIILNK